MSTESNSITEDDASSLYWTSRPDPQCFVFFKTYIDPVMYGVIILVGLTLNGTVLLIFVRHKTVRTSGNVMILNLAVCDILNISVNAPLHYLFRYATRKREDLMSCKLHTVVHQFLRSFGATSLVAISVQRYCATVPRKHPRALTGLLVLAAWTVPLAMSLPSVLIWDFYAFMCADYQNPAAAKILVAAHSVFYCVLLPVLLLGFNSATARRLKASAARMREGNLRAIMSRRKRSANVVIALAVLYICSNVPYWMWILAVYFGDQDRKNIAVLFLEYFSKYLLFAVACFNPVALYFTSGLFRSLFRRQLFFSDETVQCADANTVQPVVVNTGYAQ